MPLKDDGGFLSSDAWSITRNQRITLAEQIGGRGPDRAKNPGVRAKSGAERGRVFTPHTQSGPPC